MKVYLFLIFVLTSSALSTKSSTCSLPPVRKLKFAPVTSGFPTVGISHNLELLGNRITGLKPIGGNSIYFLIDKTKCSFKNFCGTSAEATKTENDCGEVKYSTVVGEDITNFVISTYNIEVTTGTFTEKTCIKVKYNENFYFLGIAANLSQCDTGSNICGAANIYLQYTKNNGNNLNCPGECFDDPNGSYYTEFKFTEYADEATGGKIVLRNHNDYFLHMDSGALKLKKTSTTTYFSFPKSVYSLTIAHSPSDIIYDFNPYIIGVTDINSRTVIIQSVSVQGGCASDAKSSFRDACPSGKLVKNIYGFLGFDSSVDGNSLFLDYSVTGSAGNVAFTASGAAALGVKHLFQITATSSNIAKPLKGRDGMYDEVNFAKLDNNLSPLTGGSVPSSLTGTFSIFRCDNTLIDDDNNKGKYPLFKIYSNSQSKFLRLDDSALLGGTRIPVTFGRDNDTCFRIFVSDYGYNDMELDS